MLFITLLISCQTNIVFPQTVREERTDPSQSNNLTDIFQLNFEEVRWLGVKSSVHYCNLDGKNWVVTIFTISCHIRSCSKTYSNNDKIIVL